MTLATTLALAALVASAAAPHADAHLSSLINFAIPGSLSDPDGDGVNIFGPVSFSLPSCPSNASTSPSDREGKTTNLPHDSTRSPSLPLQESTALGASSSPRSSTTAPGSRPCTPSVGCSVKGLLPNHREPFTTLPSRSRHVWPGLQRRERRGRRSKRGPTKSWQS